MQSQINYESNSYLQSQSRMVKSDSQNRLLTRKPDKKIQPFFGRKKQDNLSLFIPDRIASEKVIKEDKTEKEQCLKTKRNTLHHQKSLQNFYIPASRQIKFLSPKNKQLDSSSFQNMVNNRNRISQYTLEVQRSINDEKKPKFSRKNRQRVQPNFDVSDNSLNSISIINNTHVSSSMPNSENSTINLFNNIEFTLEQQNQSLKNDVKKLKTDVEELRRKTRDLQQKKHQRNDCQNCIRLKQLEINLRSTVQRLEDQNKNQKEELCFLTSKNDQLENHNAIIFQQLKQEQQKVEQLKIIKNELEDMIEGLLKSLKQETEEKKYLQIQNSVFQRQKYDHKELKTQIKNLLSQTNQQKKAIKIYKSQILNLKVKAKTQKEWQDDYPRSPNIDRKFSQDKSFVFDLDFSSDHSRNEQ